MQRWFVQFIALVGLFMVAGCTAGKPSYTPDDSTPEPGDTSARCAPSISDLTFYQGTDADGNPVLSVVFSYSLKCDASVDGGTVRMVLVDKDAQENGAQKYSASYDFPISLSEDAATYVTVDTDAKTATIDIGLAESQTTTTYEFKVKLIDSNGYTSNELDDTAVYVDADTAS